jgi:hypothetical protein
MQQSFEYSEGFFCFSMREEIAGYEQFFVEKRKSCVLLAVGGSEG